jgi:hypothetical protein
MDPDLRTGFIKYSFSGISFIEPITIFIQSWVYLLSRAFIMVVRQPVLIA